MNNSIAKLKKSFQNKITRLEEARKQLKEEYVGVDSAIDEIIENIRSWYTLAEIQPKPSIVNLWGLTGVGKTSLIQRLSELLAVNERTFRIDLGEKNGKYALKTSIEEIAEVSQDEPMIIILDEIQHARTIKMGLTREEIDNDMNRMIWDLIDSGKIVSNSWSYEATQIFQYTNFLSVLITHGVKIESGLVVDRVEFFAKEVEQKFEFNIGFEESKVDTLVAIPEHMFETIMSNSPSHYDFTFTDDLKEHLMTLDGKALISFLKEVSREAKKPKVAHFHKALIFVVGNLDEAYTFNNNQSADISADEFYERTKEINVPQIKEALLNRFRSEQIARLGNMHVIYPALNERAFRRLISMNLKKYFDELIQQYNIEWSFKTSLVDKIYAEGVYPTQGVRPVFTTIDQLVKSKTALIFQRIIEEEIEVNSIVLEMSEGNIRVNYFHSSKLLLKEDLSLPSNLESLRSPKHDENQAITAVHEAGHAVVMAHLLGNSPQLLTASSSDSKSEGFMMVRPKYQYFPKHELVKQAAVKLGGLMAEQVVFGEEHITMGSISDIHQMQAMVEMAYKKSGLGRHSYFYANNISDEHMGCHDIESVENEIKNTISEARELCLTVLKKERHMLIHLADLLQNVSKVDQKEFEKMYHERGVKAVDFKSESTYYRDKIREELEKMERMRSIAEHRSIILNREQQDISSSTIISQNNDHESTSY